MLFLKKRPVTAYFYSIFAFISALTIALAYFFELLPDSFHEFCIEYVFWDLTTLMMVSGMIFNTHIFLPIVFSIIVLLLSAVMMYTRWIKATSIFMIIVFTLDILFFLLMIFETYEALFFVVFRVFAILVCYDNIRWCKKQSDNKTDMQTPAVK